MSDVHPNILGLIKEQISQDIEDIKTKLQFIREQKEIINTILFPTSSQNIFLT